MHYCLWCDEPYFQGVTWLQVFGLTEDDRLCEECRHRLTIISGEICRDCGRMLENTDTLPYYEKDQCYDCARWEKNPDWTSILAKNRSLYRYDEMLQIMLARFKFRGDAELVHAFKADWKRLWDHEYKGQVAVPIPLSDQRLYERGFNQSLLLANLLNVKVADCLVRLDDEGKQSKKSRQERLTAKAPFFAMRPQMNVKDLPIVLIDDVYTTGITVRQAAKVLLEHGARTVSSLTLAR